MNNENKEKKLKELAPDEIIRIKEKYPLGTKVIMPINKIHIRWSYYSISRVMVLEYKQNMHLQVM